MNNPMRAEQSNIELLERRLGANWSAIRKAHADTISLRRDLALFLKDDEDLKNLTLEYGVF
jgi:hypothetical protein